MMCDSSPRRPGDIAASKSVVDDRLASDFSKHPLARPIALVVHVNLQHRSMTSDVHWVTMGSSIILA